MELAKRVARALDLSPSDIENTIALLDNGSTIPFIARYRKERTGSLDEEQIRQISETAERIRTLEKRRETVLASVEEQGYLTPELEEKIKAAATLTELEDLYQPYRPKRRTRASIARERGLEPLAKAIIAQEPHGPDAETLAVNYLTGDVPTSADALAGARDIVAETISDDPDVRGPVRTRALRYGRVSSSKLEDAQDEKGVYRTYYDFSHRAVSIQPYQVLAINRGEAENVLKAHVELEPRDWEEPIGKQYPVNPHSPLTEQLRTAITDAVKRLLLPAIERDVRRTLTESAESHAIDVFASNLRGLLNQPPLADHVVLGIDPGYRTGSKVAVVDPTGRVLTTSTIYPHPPQKQWEQARHKLESLIDEHNVTLIAIGNGTASRETEALAAEITSGRDDVRYLITNEAGASVYSASKLAARELPDLDVTLRGAVSIARRVQDPLAELVKIDPRSIGVGLYQHDVDQKQLAATLDMVVVSVVNNVGVDVNTASPALLTHVSGIGSKLADRIVAHRDDNGPFHTRRALKSVPGLGPKAFEQSAGFLRIRGGDEPLDASAIHPESYDVARKLLKRAGLDDTTPPEAREVPLRDLRQREPLQDLADSLGTGVPTLTDIMEQLVRPGRDPRADLPAPVLRSDVMTMDDLQKGLTLDGTVRNVVDFGIFVDIGVKQDGLLHRSRLPKDVTLTVGDVVQVEVVSVDKERERIGLAWPGMDDGR